MDPSLAVILDQNIDISISFEMSSWLWRLDVNRDIMGKKKKKIHNLQLFFCVSVGKLTFGQTMPKSHKSSAIRKPRAKRFIVRG